MAQLAIKGHATRGSEVIELLEMMGGINSAHFQGEKTELAYYIEVDTSIWCINIETEYHTKFYKITLEEFEEKFPYKVGDKVLLSIGGISTIKSMYWSSEANSISYKVNGIDDCDFHVSALQPYKEETMDIPNKLKPVIDLSSYSKDEYIIKLGDYEIKEIDGVLKAIRKQYPKTYDECYELMDIQNKLIPRGIYGYKADLLSKFQQLLICRDAYWKIAGNWKPNFVNNCDTKYIITTECKEIYKDESIISNYVLIFPTVEMRDAFYENFKDLIETCKELL